MLESVADTSVCTQPRTSITGPRSSRSGLRLHWLREPAIGVVHTVPIEVSELSVDSVASAICGAVKCPPAAAHELALKVVSRVDGTSHTVEVQFPVLRFKHWNNRVKLISSWHSEVDEDGRILLREGSRSALELDAGAALSSALLSIDSRFTLSFTDRRKISNLQARLGLTSLMTRYNFSPEDIAWVEGQDFREPPEVSLTVSLPSGYAAAWLATPDERAQDFFATYIRMSKSVQSALRHWLPYALFRGAENYADPEFGWPLAAYQAMRPFRGQPRYSFTYDVLNTEAVELAFRLAKRDLEPLAPRIASALRSTGHIAAARFYSPEGANELVDAVRKQRRSMYLLLSGDTAIVDALVALGVKGNEIGKLVRKDPRSAANALSRATEVFVKSFQARLKRQYAREDFRAFGPMLFIEATAALCSDAVMGATLRITSGDATYLLTNR